MPVMQIIANGVVVQASLIGAFYLYYLRRQRGVRGSGMPILSILLIAVMVIVSVLAFLNPEILTMLRRDPDALRSGEVWRILSPLLVQAHGPVQLAANSFFLVAFAPLAEKLYGAGLLVIFFFAGLVGQAANYFWEPIGAGSSTAIFGVMGSLFVYTLRNRKEVEIAFPVIAALGLVAGGMLVFYRDGHGAGLLAGALISLFLKPSPVPAPTVTAETEAEADAAGID